MSTKFIQKSKIKICQNNSTLYRRPVFLAVTGLLLWLIGIEPAHRYDEWVFVGTSYKMIFGIQQEGRMDGLIDK